MRIDICIATFKRPLLLERLLNDLLGQRLPDEVSTQIIVVDNDPMETGRPVVAAFKECCPSIEYHTQPQQNISVARNRALDHATGAFIALIDDDESAPVDWLATLLATMQKYSADVVFGPVISVLPGSAPDWIKKGHFFQVEPSLRTGDPVAGNIGGSGNALLRASSVRGKYAFDPRFGLSGGGDTHFFQQMRLDGATLVWCREARVTEPVPEERIAVRWLLRRAIRTGQNYTEILNRPEGGLRFAGWFATRVLAVLTGGALAVATFAISRSMAMHFAIKCASNIGQLSWLASYRLLEYKPYP